MRSSSLSLVRRPRAARCPFCRHDLGKEAEHVCGECSVALHSECAAELRGCPTLGCLGEPAERVRWTQRVIGWAKELLIGVLGMGLYLSLGFLFDWIESVSTHEPSILVAGALLLGLAGLTLIVPALAAKHELSFERWEE